MCKVLRFAPSSWHEHASRKADPEKRPQRAKTDAALSEKIRTVFNDNYGVYGVRKIWRQLKRQGEDVARCTVARLMKTMGLRGIIRGKHTRTTISDKTAASPLDLVKRQFMAAKPNMLWVSDFPYVRTWAGFAYVAFVIDTFARRIVGWKVSRNAQVITPILRGVWRRTYAAICVVIRRCIFWAGVMPPRPMLGRSLL